MMLGREKCGECLPLFLLPILFAAFLVRWLGVSDYYYSADELMHTFIASGDSFADVWQRGLYELHPPLGHFVRHLWLEISDGIGWNRLLSVISGVSTTYIFYLIGKEILGKTGGVALSILAFVSPIVVTYSQTARNYSFYLLIISLLFLFFFRFCNNRSNRNLLLYLLFAFLACATHFSGFIVTAGLGVTQFINLIIKKEYKLASIAAISHLSCLVLLVTFYFYYFAPETFGAGWRDFFIGLEPLRTQRFSEVSLLFRLLSLFISFYGISMSFDLIMMGVTCYGLFLLFKEKRIIFFSLLAIFAIQLCLAVLNLYPLAGGRYDLYLFPVLAIPVAAVMQRIIGERGLVFYNSVSASAILFAGIAGVMGFYIIGNSELNTSSRGYEEALRHLKTHKSADDIIITNRGSSLYLQYAENQGKVMYSSGGIGRLNFDGAPVVYDNRPYFWENITQKNFSEFLNRVSISDKERLSKPGTVWFLVLGTSDYAIFTIWDCEAFKDRITDAYQGRGVLLLAMKTQDFAEEILKKPEQLSGCYAASSAPELSTDFGAMK